MRLCCENLKEQTFQQSGMARAALCISTPSMSESEQNRVRLVAAIRKYYQRLVFQGCCLAHSAYRPWLVSTSGKKNKYRFFLLFLLQDLKISRYKWLMDCFCNKLPSIPSVTVSQVCQSLLNLCACCVCFHKHSSGLKNRDSCDDDYSCHGDRIWSPWAAEHLTN